MWFCFPSTLLNKKQTWSCSGHELSHKAHCKMFEREVSSGTMKLQFPLYEMEADLRIRNRNNYHINKRRFNDDQISSLETIYQTESRPELRMKQQLANNLGLQPRQIAVWFQNKRARSKPKQIEQEYSMLKASYDNLASRFESVKKENQSLLLQLQKLKKLASNVGPEDYEIQDDSINFETNSRPEFLQETYSCQVHLSTCNDNSDEVDYLWQEDSPHDMPQLAEGSITSTNNEGSFRSDELLDNSIDYSQWWIHIGSGLQPDLYNESIDLDTSF